MEVAETEHGQKLLIKNEGFLAVFGVPHEMRGDITHRMSVPNG
jgi:hypothetical protein